MGWSFAESWVCSYQWHEESWQSLLVGTRSEQFATYGLELPLSAGCLILRGNIGGPEYLPTGDHQPNEVHITTLIDPYGCGGWEANHTLIWDGNIYLQQVALHPPSDAPALSVIGCVGAAWEWASSLQNITDVIGLMENSLYVWSDLEMQNSDPFSALLEPNFRDQFRFQLGRLYALAGNLEKSRETLLDVINHPDDQSNSEWFVRAQGNLGSLGNLKKAEQ
jgi:hypothetical protein